MLRRVMRGFITAGCIGWFLVGCGGNQAPAESPAEPEPLTLEAKAEPSEEPKAEAGGDEDQGDGLASDQGKTEHGVPSGRLDGRRAGRFTAQVTARPAR